MTDTLKQITEDILLTAHHIRNGNYYDDLPEGIEPGDEAGPLSYRITQIVVNLAERLAAVSGIPVESIWVPELVDDMLDPEWGTNYIPIP